jgi:hypothetical protein
MPFPALLHACWQWRRCLLWRVWKRSRQGLTCEGFGKLAVQQGFHLLQAHSGGLWRTLLGRERVDRIGDTARRILLTTIGQSV